jgi:cardiolipin synthase
MQITINTEWLAVAFALFYFLAIVSAIEAILKSRTAQGAIAWVVSLLSIPYLSVPLYLIFGRNRFDGYVRERQQIEAIAHARLRETRFELATFRASDANAPFYESLQRLARLPTVRGNEVTLLVDGAATFASIEAGLREARHYILFQFYILRDDALGRRLGTHLAERARAGVSVCVLYDEMGSAGFGRSGLYHDLRDAGVRLAAFNTTQGRRNRLQLNFRNHRKVVVVDGREAWIGGHNVGDEYLGLDPELGAWRDTHLSIRGPAALGAQLAFAEDWRWATGAMPKVDWTPVAAPDGADARVLVMPTGPADELDTAGLMFVHAIQSANERIWIASPYFVPDDAVLTALQLARLRGVDVRILIPDRPDQLLVYLAAYTYFDQVDVPFFRYTEGFLHQKVMLIDDDVAAIGTANFDNRSFRLNFELTALVSDPEFVERVEAMLEADLARSRRMEPGELAAKPWYFRLGARVARLMSPIL